MKKALKKVLTGLSSKERDQLNGLIAKAMRLNYSYPCPGDCDRNLARINLCPHCQLEEQILVPLLNALEEIKEMST